MSKIEDILLKGIHSAVISQKNKDSKSSYNKVTIKPFLSKEAIKYQFSYYEDKKVFHKNLELNETVDEIVIYLKNHFFQCLIFGSENDVHLTSFGGKFKYKTLNSTKKIENLSHDRKKKYIIEDGAQCDFLIELGICAKDGKVKKEKYSKFRQINKYLEFIDGIKSNFENKQSITIVDFGCGKAYLSFALYYYFVEILKIKAEILGLDLKQDVVEYCQSIADKLSYDGLSFKVGDIGKYSSDKAFDMVVSLHACDTATDEAINKAVKWKSKVILFVPCCQHELNPQLKSDTNEGILRFGLERERLATIITDTSRALLLESIGYHCEIQEFIETEHTPKNVMIKAVYTGKILKKSKEQYEKLKAEWNFSHHLEKLLNKE